MPKVTDIQRAIDALIDEKIAIERAIGKLQEQQREKPTRTRKLKPTTGESA